YERAGFMHTATKEEGPIGKERLYYLDLDHKYVSSLKLIKSEGSKAGPIEIVNFILDGEKVGFLAIEAFNERLIIRALYVDDAHRDTGIAQNALRQLATYVRKENHDTKVIEVTLFGPNHQLTPLFVKSNFVETLTTDDYVTLEKYINY
ncbi:GNAT family N-acetyltransferase, partial [Staphylococcus pseudintermedius]|nr:GNAT family N-acetyltransferase [Staphylococcus pseudintermedius]